MLDATVGAATSTSYCSVAEADQYFADRLYATAWDTSTVQEAALVTATRQLDYSVTWHGTRVDNTQALDWPRTGVNSPYGTAYVETDIPIEVKHAVFELALYSLAADHQAPSDLAGLSMVQAGPLTIKADSKDQNSDTAKPIPKQVWQLLTNLCTRGSGVTRLSRA